MLQSCHTLYFRDMIIHVMIFANIIIIKTAALCMPSIWVSNDS